MKEFFKTYYQDNSDFYRIFGKVEGFEIVYLTIFMPFNMPFYLIRKLLDL